MYRRIVTFCFFFSSRRRHTRCALVTGVQTCALPISKIYREKVSAATAERLQLKRAIGALDAGDVLMVTATDRLARNTRDLLNILHAVKEAGAGFRSIAEPMVDTTSQFAE